MTDETNFVGWLLGGGGVGMALSTYLGKRAIKQVDDTLKAHDATLKEHTKQHAACHLDLANFKTEVAKEYAKEETVQQSLSRIHDRIDTVSSDIKEILSRVGSVRK